MAHLCDFCKGGAGFRRVPHPCGLCKLGILSLILSSSRTPLLSRETEMLVQFLQNICNILQA